jgi:copper chaperone CopZ
MITMKNSLFLILATLLMLLSCNGNKTPEESTDALEMDSARMVVMKYSVEGMTCGGCENTVINALEGLNGIDGVEASFKEAYVQVTFDTAMVTQDQIAETVTSKGYTFAGLFEEE